MNIVTKINVDSWIINTQYEIHNTSNEISSTTVESALQIAPFLQNKPNFRETQMSVSTIITKNYEQLTMNNELKNKPNTNPIYHGVASGEAGIYHGVASGEAGLKPIKCQNKPNTNPIKPNL